MLGIKEGQALGGTDMIEPAARCGVSRRDGRDGRDLAQLAARIALLQQRHGDLHRRVSGA